MLSRGQRCSALAHLLANVVQNLECQHSNGVSRRVVLLVDVVEIRHAKTFLICLVTNSTQTPCHHVPLICNLGMFVLGLTPTPR